MLLKMWDEKCCPKRFDYYLGKSAFKIKFGDDNERNNLQDTFANLSY